MWGGGQVRRLDNEHDAQVRHDLNVDGGGIRDDEPGRIEDVTYCHIAHYEEATVPAKNPRFFDC